MIEIFKQIPEIKTGVLRPPNWDYVSDGINENINTVVTYYKEHKRSVRSDHILIRLLHSITVPKRLSLDRYFANVDAVALDLSMAFRMTSSIYKGKMFRGIFYGGANPEILIATDEYFDVEKAHNNWKNVEAVKVLLHPKSDMDYQIPNGIEYSHETGLSVILINITMLAVQYRAFCLSQELMADGNKNTINQFIGSYVLPNMIGQQSEIALFNKVYNKVNEIDSVILTDRKHPFAMANYKSILSSSVDRVVDYLNKSSKSFRTVFHTVPSFKNQSMYKSLLLPDLAITRSVDWALVATRLKMIDFLITVSGKEILSKNQMQLNQILRSFRANNISNMFEENMPLDVSLAMDVYADRLLEVMGRKTF